MFLDVTQSHIQNDLKIELEKVRNLKPVTAIVTDDTYNLLKVTWILKADSSKKKSNQKNNAVRNLTKKYVYSSYKFCNINIDWSNW